MKTKRPMDKQKRQPGGSLKPVGSAPLGIGRWCGAIRAHLTSPTDAGYEADAWDALMEMEKLIKPNIKAER